MENHRYVKISKIIIWGGTLLALPFFMLAYDDKTTHPALTQEIVKFYNKNFPEKQLNSVGMELVIKGSMDEDLDTRWLYHFYDPVYDRGLVLENDAFPDDTSLALIASGAKSSYESSKKWGTRSDLQNDSWNLTAGIFSDYFSGSKDYSWERAVYDYAWRDKNRGLETLGHVLHLLEDATVPDHTRNDPHPPVLDLGSPYEGWTKRFNRESFSFSSNDKSIVLTSIENYFDAMARYSNNNFFSKDTILTKNYHNPIVAYYSTEHLSNSLTYNFAYSKNNFRLFRSDKEMTWYNLLEENSNVYLNDPDDLILTDYWTLLSKQAVLHGAGVIKLFFDEVEKEKQTRALYNKNRSWFGKVLDYFSFWKSSTNVTGTNVNLATVIAPINTTSPTSEVSLPAGRETSIESTEVIEVSPPIPPSGGATSIVSNPAVLGVTTATPPPTNVTVTSSSGGGGGGDYTSPSLTTETAVLTSPSTPSEAASSTPGVPPSTPGVFPAASEPPPSINLTVKECENSFSAENCLIAASTINIEWSSDTSTLDHFEILCLLNALPCTGFDFSNTTATSTIYILPEDNSIYTFSAKAVDAMNQKSSTTIKTLEFATRPVIINEIAWAGTSAENPQDEWIELYNPTASPINLSGIKLKSLTDGKPEKTLEGKIKPKEYYLIERTDDTTVSDIPANLVASFGSGTGSGLSNSGEILVLEFNNAILDQTPDPEKCSGWCAGIPSPYFYSMERYDPFAPGENKNNWNHWTGTFANGKNADGLTINGTPKKRNSVNYWIDNAGTYLTKNKTLKKSSSPYFIPSTSFAIPENLELKIEPGVTVKFANGGSMDVVGKLEALGTADNPIVFTSLKDDSHAGDTNQDGNATEPKAGDWTAIRALNNGSLDFSDAIIRFGGIYDPLGFARAQLKAEGGNLTVKNSIIENSGSFGLWLRNSSSSFSGNTIRNNTVFHNSDSTGMVIEGGTAEITDNTFENNHFGLMLLPSLEGGNQHDFRISGNKFINNEGYAVFSNNSYPEFSGNSAQGNGINGIGIQGALTKDLTLSPDLAYVIENNSFYIPEEKTLNVLSGTVLKFYGSGTIDIRGALKAEGTTDQKVVFTSINDDEHGGDTNGTSTEALPGDWNNIRFLTESKGSVLDNTVIRYGGTKNLFYGERGAIKIQTASTTQNALQIKNSIIEKNYAAGIWMQNAGSTLIENTIIQNHKEPTFENTTGLLLTNSSVTLSNTTFKNNKIGILADQNSSVENLGGIIFEGNDTDTNPPGLLP